MTTCKQDLCVHWAGDAGCACATLGIHRDHRSPDCREGKHHACRGDAWDHQADTPTDCTCSCHEEANAA